MSGGATKSELEILMGLVQSLSDDFGTRLDSINSELKHVTALTVMVENQNDKIHQQNKRLNKITDKQTELEIASSGIENITTEVKRVMDTIRDAKEDLNIRMDTIDTKHDDLKEKFDIHQGTVMANNKTMKWIIGILTICIGIVLKAPWS